MPGLRKEVSSGIQKEVVRLAQEENGQGGYAYTYQEIAEVAGDGLSKDDISAICLQNGIRRKVRGPMKHSEDSILAEIKRLHEELTVVRQRVKISWNLTGVKFEVENCSGKSDAEIVHAVRNFLKAQRVNRASVGKSNGTH